MKVKFESLTACETAAQLAGMDDSRAGLMFRSRAAAAFPHCELASAQLACSRVFKLKSQQSLMLSGPHMY